MVYRASVVSVMIASPGDVGKERELVRNIIHETNDLHAANNQTVLLPVGWETHTAPELAGRAQEIINKNIVDKCDLLVGIFWTRLGTPTGEAESGTVEEIKRHVEAGKPAMIYFSAVPVAPESLNQKQYKALSVFKDWCKGQGLIEFYEDTTTFVEKFRRQLQIILRDNAYLRDALARSDAPDWVSGDGEASTQTVRLSQEAATLLLEAVKSDGEIMNLSTLSGRHMQVNGKTYPETNDRRTAAKWEAGLEELEQYGLIVARGFKREIFEVTAKGFEAADSAVES
jgi:hypothetical protein